MIDRFEFQAPPPALQGLIKYVWVFEGRASDSDPYHHKALVDGCTQWLIAYRGRFRRIDANNHASQPLTSAVVAQTTESLTYRLSEDFGLVGVCLYPFTLPYVFGVHGTDYIDRYYAPSEFFSDRAAPLEQAVIEADTHESRLDLLFDFLLSVTARPSNSEPPVLRQIRKMFQCTDPLELNELIHPADLSERHFQRRVKHYTGYTPKQLARILRLQLAMQPRPSTNLSETATRASYYDQSHLTNEFRHLTGLSPREYFKGLRPDARWRRLGKEVGFFQETSEQARYGDFKTNQGTPDDNY